MRVLNLTPFLFGTKVTSLAPPRPHMTVVVRAAYVLSPTEPLRLPEGEYPLSQGHLTGDVYAPDDEQRTGQLLYASDFADFKPRADLLLRGTCHAPNGRRVTECPVRFSVGSFSKTLTVVGQRRYLAEGRPETTEPEGFTRMSLGYENAYGGAGYAKNPVGRGYLTKDASCIERAPRGAAAEPLSFGPWSPSWPPRSEMLGKDYGAEWQKKRRPYFASDFDFRHFNAAPADQQVSYLRGDEEVGFVHLHPTVPSFTTRLPGLRIRAFVNDVERRFREVKMVLDTLFADMDASRLYLTFRGVEPVSADDLADVVSLLLASEPLAEPQKPEDHYRDLLLEFESASPTAQPKAPEHLRDLWALVERSGAEAPPEAPPAKGPRNPVSARLASRLGDGLPEVQRDVAKSMRAARRATGKEGPRFVGAVRKAALGVDLAGAPPALDPRAPHVDLSALDKALRRAARQAVSADPKSPSREALAQIAALSQDPNLRALDPSFGRPGPRKPPREGLVPGADLSHKDLRDLDLTDIDLSGANLEGALLSGSCLKGAKLRKAILRAATLFETDLTLADLTEADLSRATLTSAVAEDAVFKGAVLDLAQVKRASLVRADLTGAKGRATVFEEADLTGAQLSEAVFEAALFDRAILKEARGVRARLPACRFLFVEGEGLNFELATLEGASFAGAALTGARLVQIAAQKSIWIRAQAPKADLRYSDLREAHFEEASLEGASFRASDLALARFYRASLDKASFAGANLRSADMCKASLAGANLSQANMYDAKLLQVSLTGCDLTGAVLTRATMETA